MRCCHRCSSLTVKEEEIIKLFSKYGDIHKTFMMIPNRGIAFVTFVCLTFSPVLHTHTSHTHCSTTFEMQFKPTEAHRTFALLTER